MTKHDKSKSPEQPIKTTVQDGFSMTHVKGGFITTHVGKPRPQQQPQPETEKKGFSTQHIKTKPGSSGNSNSGE